jgi:hypothetical protein
MKSNSCLVNSLKISFWGLLMGVFGLVLSYFLFLDTQYEIPWGRYHLPDAPKEAINIVFVEIVSTLEDPSGDIIYISTEDSSVYSNTLYENSWLLVESVSNWDSDHISDCAPVWPGAPTDAQIWEAPPVKNNIIDSAGVRFERPLSIIVRCYVLSDDGSLEVWVREDNAGKAGVYSFAFFAPRFAILGIMVGVIIGVLIIRFRQRRDNLKI